VRHMHPGQPVTIHVGGREEEEGGRGREGGDTFGRDYKGTVEDMAGAAGPSSVYSAGERERQLRKDRAALSDTHPHRQGRGSEPRSASRYVRRSYSQSSLAPFADAVIHHDNERKTHG